MENTPFSWIFNIYGYRYYIDFAHISWCISRISLLPAQVRNCEMEYKVLMDIEYLWILHIIIYRYWIHIDIAFLPAQVGDCEMEYIVIMDIKYFWILDIKRYWNHIDIAHPRWNISRISFLPGQVGDCATVEQTTPRRTASLRSRQGPCFIFKHIQT